MNKTPIGRNVLAAAESMTHKNIFRLHSVTTDKANILYRNVSYSFDFILFKKRLSFFF